MLPVSSREGAGRRTREAAGGRGKAGGGRWMWTSEGAWSKIGVKGGKGGTCEGRWIE